MSVTLRLRRREERRLLAGHLWVFSNEIDTGATPLKGLEPGTPVRLESAEGKFLAHAYANPASLIAARVTSRTSRAPFDEAMLRARLAAALRLREHRYGEPFYRWVHGEGDLLPGLVVDRFGDALVVQLTTAGAERLRGQIVAALAELSGASSITLANEGAVRALEGLPRVRESALGAPPDTLSVRENGLDFTVPADVTQKTGWFYDHRESRRALRRWVRGARVLDLYSYLGAFGLNAAAGPRAGGGRAARTGASGGAREVVAIDASATAVAAANGNARANGLDGVFEARVDDAIEAMRAMVEAGERFDVVVLDPPAFVKRRKDLDAGTRHYALNNRLAMRLLAPGGILLSASCSQAVDEAALARIVHRAVPKESAGLQLLEPLRQAPDHPVHSAMPETLYLSGTIARLL